MSIPTTRILRGSALGALLALGGLAAACGGDTGDTADGAELTGTVLIDGSSTVFPIAEAMAEEFGIAHQGRVRAPVGLSGTGGGFKKFCAGETDISNASRRISEDETALCRQNGIDPLELPIAWDGLTVVKNPANDWATCMTVEELRRVWQPGSTITRWNQVRSGWPDAEIKLYGADTDSGTFDYFTEAIMGESGARRDDYTASADDNVLVVGVAGDEASLGYFGFAYYLENTERLDAVEIDGGAGCVAPTRETIEDGSYTPLSRPMFIYAKAASMERPVVAEFLRFWIENSLTLVPEVGYVPLSEAEYAENLATLEAALAPDAAGVEPSDSPEAAAE
jgi:phosphate transport system substrate-binding protein